MNIVVLLKTVKRTKNVLVWQLQWLLGRYFSQGFARSQCLKVAFARYFALLCCFDKIFVVSGGLFLVWVVVKYCNKYNKLNNLKIKFFNVDQLNK